VDKLRLCEGSLCLNNIRSNT